MKYPEYREWAIATLKRKPSLADWEGLTIAQAAGRAQTLIEVANGDGYAMGRSMVAAVDHLEKLVETLTERYPRR